MLKPAFYYDSAQLVLRFYDSSKDTSREPIPLFVFGSAYFLRHGFAWYSGAYAPKSDPTFSKNRQTELRVSFGVDSDAG
jgi:hypothetical protein